MAFTRSGETAQIIMRQAADQLKRLTFELGGKSPNIVFADADLDAAAAGAHVGIHLNQGQCCCAGSRLFVEDSIHASFVDRVVEMSRSRRVGDPFDAAIQQGPQVDKAQFDKIMGYIEAGKREGALCATGVWSPEGNEIKKFSIGDDTPADKKPAAGVALLPMRVVISADGATVLAGDSAGRLHGWPTK